MFKMIKKNSEIADYKVNCRETEKISGGISGMFLGKNLSDEELEMVSGGAHMIKDPVNR